MNSIKVYKTNVENQQVASEILEAIIQHHPVCEASFDLEDCDKVLRIENPDGGINEGLIQQILKSRGHKLELLP